MSAFDAAAASFDRRRALPDGVPGAIRAAILAAIGAPTQPRLLDLGAGTGRIGWSFVAAGDDYVGVDLSLGMLREFRRRTDATGRAPRLVQADGQRLPLADETFDAVLLIQVFGGMRGWRRLLAEARRVLRSPGTLITGRTVAPVHGIDEQLKQRLALLLHEMGIQPDANPRDDAHRSLELDAQDGNCVVAATWNAKRTARDFLDRHRTGARFSMLPDSVKEEALRKLGAWAEATFGSLDAVVSEQHAFELLVFKFTRSGLLKCPT
jgi:ubiquinone/menaquinone biosynthesis C-methylase UbiE